MRTFAKWILGMGVLLVPGIFLLPYGPTQAQSQSRYDFEVIDIYDGDTFYIIMPGLPPELQRLGVRVRGIDTAEMRGKCDFERHTARGAKFYTTRLIRQNGNHVTLTGLKWDKYGGRIDADVWLGNQKLSDMMIIQGYARPYSGGKRKSWCNG